MTNDEAIELGRRLVAAGLELEPAMMCARTGQRVPDSDARTFWDWRKFFPDLRDRATFLLVVDQMDRRQDEYFRMKRLGRFAGDSPEPRLVALFEHISKACEFGKKEQQP
jgi:hypothetical protein